MRILIYISTKTAVMANTTVDGYVTVALTAEFLKMLTFAEKKLLLTHIENTGNNKKLYSTFFIGFGAYCPVAPTLEEVKKALAEEVISIQQEHKKKEEEILKWLENSEKLVSTEKSVKHADSAYSVNYAAQVYNQGNFYEFKNDERVEARIAEIEKSEEKINAENYQAALEKSLKQQQEADARKQAEKEQRVAAEKKEKLAVNTWVQEHAHDLWPRYNEDLLPEHELITALENHFFAGITLGLAGPIQSAEINCDCDFVKNNHRDLQRDELTEVKLTQAEYLILTDLRKSMPSTAELKLKKYRGYCETCFQRDKDDGQVERNFAEITFKWHNYTLTRRYSLEKIS